MQNWSRWATCHERLISGLQAGLWTHVVVGFDDQPAPIDSRALALFEDEALAKQFLRILNDYQARQPDPDILEALREWVARHPCAPVAGLFNRFELQLVPHLEAAL